MSSHPAADLGRPVEILLVEDNPADVWITTEQLKKLRVANRVSVVSNGLEAMAYLRRQGGYGEAARPDLVLLDLNLPKMNGRAVLAEVRADPELCMVPVIVLTTSDAESDVLRSYALHANAYLTKPADLEAFGRMVAALEDFWFTTARLPGQ
jgi:CheY-like chemotaxis protein